MVLYKADSMESKNDCFWRCDGLHWKSGPHQYLPASSKKWLVMYFYLPTKDGKIWRRRELVPVRGWEGNELEKFNSSSFLNSLDVPSFQLDLNMIGKHSGVTSFLM